MLWRQRRYRSCWRIERKYDQWRVTATEGGNVASCVNSDKLADRSSDNDRCFKLINYCGTRCVSAS